MSSKTIVEIVLVAVVVLGGGWYIYVHGSASPAKEVQTQNVGTYQYECDEHVQFSMTPASDMSSIHVAPVNGGVYPPDSTLMKKAATTSAARYENNGVVFTATGETVTLGEGDSAINCSPVPNGGAPFNWGDK